MIGEYHLIQLLIPQTANGEHWKFGTLTLLYKTHIWKEVQDIYNKMY